jgi:ATP-dependent Clp protease adaptor protein ClpS
MSDVIQSSNSTKINIKKPSLYKILFFNDDYTPFLFVEKILTVIFNKTTEEAYLIAQTIHSEGSAVIAVFPKEIAVTKQAQTLYNAEKNNFPLRCEIEPEDE